MFKAVGRIKNLLPERLIKEQYRSREILLEVKDGDYLTDIGIEFFGDKTEKLNGYKEGEEVEVSFNVKGRIWDNKTFNNVRGWRISRISAAPPQEIKKVDIPTSGEGEGEGDDLPF